MNAIFELTERTPKQIILKVLAKDLLTIAQHPYLSKDMEYITVTRGENHTLTVIYTDGHTFSFHWGSSGHTLISDNLKRLQDAVCNFIETDCHILLGWDDGEIGIAKVFFNRNYSRWQLTLESKGAPRKSAYYWDETATCLQDMCETALNYIDREVFGWSKSVAVTGIDVYTAVLDD